jgi:hypothetical protein
MSAVVQITDTLIDISNAELGFRYAGQKADGTVLRIGLYRTVGSQVWN